MEPSKFVYRKRQRFVLLICASSLDIWIESAIATSYPSYELFTLFNFFRLKIWNLEDYKSLLQLEIHMEIHFSSFVYRFSCRIGLHRI